MIDAAGEGESVTECRQPIRDLRNRLQRRGFLADMGLGVTGLALGELLGRDNRTAASENSAGDHSSAEE
ncbi:MAG: hypothetical protein ACK58T_24555, partial [Phycisphaerae bacterium]